MLYIRTLFIYQSKLRLKFCLLFVLVFSILSLYAQPVANFTASAISGCSPLKVSFTNTTTAASNAAKFQWDLGNGNSSNNKDAAAIYSAEQNYTVTLTVTDNNITSSKTMSITVFKNPVPSFTVNAASGCTPFSVAFTSTSSLGTGTKGYYYWDFGDGTTLDFDSSYQSVNHIYSTSGSYTIRFQVKTNTGCSPVLLTQNSFINVQSKPIAAYTRSKAYLCSAGDEITFINNSSAVSGASYLWKFGDGSTSTEISPNHTYSTVGIFSDSLIVTNPTGCSDTTFSPTPIYCAQFLTDFVVPQTGLCAGSAINLTNISKPIPDVANWYFSSQSAATSSFNVTKIFNKEGSYTIKLVNLYGSCLDSISKTISVLPSLSIAGYTVNSAPLCGGKTSITLTDTTKSLNTLWNLEGATDTLKTNPAIYTFNQDSTYNISLTVSNSSGCAATVIQPVTVTHIPVSITSTSSNPLSNSSGCPGLKVTFLATPSSNIKTYTWNFGDSIRTSSDTSPTHTYDSVGSFPVELNYTTLDGCNDSAFLRNVIIFSMPVPSFISANQDQCGGGIQFFDQTPKPVTSWFWYFGDSTSTSRNPNYSISYTQNPKHFYYDTGYYDIKLVATNGTCSDSVAYPKYQHIKAPIAHIDSISYTCSGDRNTVLIWSYYKYVDSGTWNFGDNSALVKVDTSVHFVSHHYPKTGVYEAILTTSNGGCTPKDTSWIPILSKQSPILKASVTSICANDSLSVFIDTSTLAKNSMAGSDSNYYSVFQWQYGDASVFNTGLIQPSNWYYSNLGTLTGLVPGKTNLRVITQSEYYGCLDTSKYINLTVNGPVAGYYINSPNNCFKQPLSFTDSSHTNFGVPIVKWEWNFGDKTYDTLTKNGNITHSYASPGRYGTSLKVIDKDGCYDISQQGDSALPSGPKANFYWTPTYIITGSTASFINTTNTFEDNQVNYSWTFSSGGSPLSSKNTTHKYNKSGTDSVQLIALNPQNGCRDTVTYLVSIKNVFALFTIKTKYAKKTCPPMQAVFTSHSINADRLSWDFGDGASKSVSTDTFASHTYNEPGIYTVKLYAYKNSLLLDSSSQTITVKGAYATVTSNLTQGCIGSTITIKSAQVNTATFTWDFGDGVVIFNSPDSTISHKYVFAGVFTPLILMTDINGCSSSFPAQQPIIIDSLHTSFTISKTPVCDTGTVVFTPTIISYAADVLQQSLSYHWNFGTGNTKDTTNSLIPTFDYKTIGSYPVSQTVTSIYGCTTTVVDTVFVKPSSRGIITAPATVCEAAPVSFKATPSFAGNVEWHWDFNNGNMSNLQTPLPETFTTAKDSISHDTILLVTMLNNCYDTTSFHLTVNPFPRVNLLPKVKRICEGDTAQLAAFDGSQYNWSPNTSNSATPIIKPSSTTSFYVKVTNLYGCSNTDSTTIDVTPDIRHSLTFTRDTFVCNGLSMQLPVSGADSFVWLKDSATLKNYGNNSSSPIATPVVSPTIYEFVASDKYGCVHDTQSISVVQVPFPTISTKDTVIMPTGTSRALTATVSPDVITYNWTPADYLDNPNASSPICSPRKDIVYTVQVTNENGCSVSDSISIHLICAESLFAPSAFIPSSNYENNNLFFPKGQGLKEVIYFRVYNRIGELIFENTHFQPSIPSTGWDGTYKGKKASTGTYVYTMQAQCDTGEIFDKKGTIVLIR